MVMPKWGGGTAGVGRSAKACGVSWNHEPLQILFELLIGAFDHSFAIAHCNEEKKSRDDSKDLTLLVSIRYGNWQCLRKLNLCGMRVS